jgi:hypothetical protein
MPDPRPWPSARLPDTKRDVTATLAQRVARQGGEQALRHFLRGLEAAEVAAVQLAEETYDSGDLGDAARRIEGQTRAAAMKLVAVRIAAIRAAAASVCATPQPPAPRRSLRALIERLLGNG